MRSTLFLIPRVIAVCVLLILSTVASAAFASSFHLQDQKQGQSKDQPQVSEAEQKAIEKINTASGAEAKMKAASEYAKKYSKSPVRTRVAGFVADEIIAVKDNGQKLSLAQSFQSTFNQPHEVDMIKPALVDAYLNSGKFDEALSESAKHLERNPDDVVMLTQLTWAGANQAQKQAATPKLLQASSQAAAKAIELMEADKKPERMTAENWTAYRNSWLPRLYQAQGIIMYFGDNKAGAKEKLEKAVGFDPYDPSTLMLLVNLTNDEYQDLAKRYQAEKKSETLNQALAKMDEVIDWLARAVAATDGNAQMQTTHQQLMDNLKQYYTFRHEGKTDGLDALVKKYQKPQ
jgi:hypothetical protein